MARISILSLGACAFGAAITTALPVQARCENSSDVSAGTFANPANSVKAKFRYWFPDASIDAGHFADDIAQLGKHGAGATEFLNYYSYGGAAGTNGTDWNIYGYGTEAYLALLKAGLQAHIDNGLLFDFSMGPQSGQGVPAEPDNPGLSWELVQFNTTINGTYHGPLPGWGEGDLISASTFAVINETLQAGSYNPFDEEFGYSTNYIQYTISNESLTDVTNLVQNNGSISVTANPIEAAEYFLLHASYARRSYVRACIASSADPQNILQNGSFAVDHFSSTGAKVTTDFLEQYILIDGIKELLEQAGRYIWEDSVEISENTYWTPGLEEIFEQQHGYSILPMIPLLQGNEGYQAGTYGPVIVTDSGDGGAAFVSDFRSTMTQLLGVYYDHLVNWSHDYLGLEFSGQIGYNLPVDMLQDVPRVDAPEAETLSFQNYIDGFLQVSGPADLAGKKVISVELGADILGTYAQSWTTLLQEAKHSFMGGINQVVIHGAIYSYDYANTTWPGYASFEYEFAAQHSRHQPAWDVGYPEALGYIGRVQWVLQSGVPKVDLIFWDKQTAQNAYPSPLYIPMDLIEAGYTYEYLSPENFALDSAYVEDGIFAPTKQASKLLIIRANDTLTPEGVDYLVQYAEAGLPIVISGGVPTTYSTSNESAIAAANTALQGALELSNVHQVPYEELAGEITSLGVTPRSQVQSNGTWYTRWRETLDGDIYVYIYNDGNYSTGNITFDASGTPYYLDAWTGDETLVVSYVVNKGLTTIPFALKSTETRIIKFERSGSSKLRTHVVSSSGSVLGFKVENNTHIQAKVASSNETSIALSSGKIVSFDTTSTEPTYSLTNWSLTVEQWMSPDDVYDLTIDAKKVNASFSVEGPALPEWADIDVSLTNVSGIGYYSTSFQWSGSSSSGAYLVLPPAAQGLIGTLNGISLPVIDITNPTVDISSLLVPGTNSLVLKSSTTLWNALSPIWSDVHTGGIAPPIAISFYEESGYPRSEYGIIGEVQIVPYSIVQVV